MSCSRYGSQSSDLDVSLSSPTQQRTCAYTHTHTHTHTHIDHSTSLLCYQACSYGYVHLRQSGQRTRMCGCDSRGAARVASQLKRAQRPSFVCVYPTSCMCMCVGAHLITMDRHSSLNLSIPISRMSARPLSSALTHDMTHVCTRLRTQCCLYCANSCILGTA